MANAAYPEKTVVIGKSVHVGTQGYVVKKEGGATVKLPPHVAKFFEDHGLIS